MAISATRVAAFEFLIQFRSAGRNQVRGAVRQLRSLNRVQRNNSSTAAASARSVSAYAASLRRSNRSLLAATTREVALTTALRSGARARIRAAAATRIANARENNSRLARAFGSRSVQLTSRLFGARAAGNLAGFRSGIGSVASRIVKLGRALGPVGAALSLFFGLVRGGLGLLASWAKFNAIVLGGIGLLSVGIAKLADSFSNLTNRIRVAGDGTTTVADTTLRLRNIARESRTEFSNIAELYGRVSINAKELGVNQAEVLKLTELTAKAFKIAGITSREESQTIIQFAQALGSNRLSGDELRAVREQAPELSQSLARGLTALGNFGTVTVGRLKELGEEGVLTTRVITDALLQQEKVINQRFNRIRPKVAEGVQQLKSSLFIFAGTITESLNLGPRMFKFFDGLAQRFDALGKSSGRIALAIRRLPQLFRALGLNGLNPLFKFFDGINSFFSNLPDKIVRLANNINSFVSQINNGESAQVAAQRAFGQDLADVRRIFEPFSNISSGFFKQLDAFKDAVVTISNALLSLAAIIDDVAKVFNIIKFAANAATPLGRARIAAGGFPRSDQ